MHQNARQKAESSVERDFYKLMNNSNFGIDYKIMLTIVSLNQFTMR